MVIHLVYRRFCNSRSYRREVIRTKLEFKHTCLKRGRPNPLRYVRYLREWPDIDSVELGLFAD